MITTTPQEFAEMRARDLLLSILASHVLRREEDPHDTARQWKDMMVACLLPTLHQPENEHADRLFRKIVDVALDSVPPTE